MTKRHKTKSSKCIPCGSCKQQVYMGLGELAKVQSIITVLLIGVYAYLAVVGIINPDWYHSVVMIVVGFFFGSHFEKQLIKSRDNGKDSEDEN